MKSQIMKKSVLRNLALSIVALLALTGAAYAQQANENVNTLREKEDAQAARDAKAYMDKLEADRKYQETLKNQPTPAASNDPWGNVRPTTPAKPAVKPAAGAAKTTSGSNKSASGSGKPAVGVAASATGATQKGQ